VLEKEFKKKCKYEKKRLNRNLAAYVENWREEDTKSTSDAYELKENRVASHPR